MSTNQSIAKRPTTGGELIGSGMTFDDHRSFEGTVARAVIGGGLGALVAHVIAGGLGLASSFPLIVTLLTAGALALVGGRNKSWFHGGVGAVLGLVGGMLHGHYVGQWPWIGALLLGVLSAPILAKGESPARMSATGLFTGLMAFAGLYVAGVFQFRGVFDGIMPEALASAVAGGSAGLFLGLGSAVKHIVPADDPVEKSYDKAMRDARGELHEILDRALGIYRAVRDDLGGRHPGPTELELGDQVSNMSMRILHIAERCQTIELDLAASPREALDQRIDGLRLKVVETSDESAKRTLESAIDNLDGQRVALDAIGRGRERVVARLHANVALLEKVRFSLVHLRSADAERVGSEITPLNEAIEELSRELDATSAAVGEVYGARPTFDEVKTAPKLLPHVPELDIDVD